MLFLQMTNDLSLSVRKSLSKPASPLLFCTSRSHPHPHMPSCICSQVQPAPAPVLPSQQWHHPPSARGPGQTPGHHPLDHLCSVTLASNTMKAARMLLFPAALLLTSWSTHHLSPRDSSASQLLLPLPLFSLVCLLRTSSDQVSSLLRLYDSSPVTPDKARP